MFKILDESSTWCDVYLREEVSGMFPLKFSYTPWIEDQTNSHRASEVYPSMVAVVKYWEGLINSS